MPTHSIDLRRADVSEAPRLRAASKLDRLLRAPSRAQGTARPEVFAVSGTAVTST